MMAEAPYVRPGRGSAPDLRMYSPRVILIWWTLALATQWPAVTTYHSLTREPPHRDEPRNKLPAVQTSQGRGQPAARSVKRVVAMSGQRGKRGEESQVSDQ